MSLNQHIAKLIEWDRQTGERLIKTLDLPEDLYDEAITTVNTKNLLANRFLRERAVFFSDPQASEKVTRVLAKVGMKINKFGQQMNAYMHGVGMEELDEAEIEALWLKPSDFAAWSALSAEGE